jgi:N-acetylglutamate synthase-like GNAT family acetyltransferase
VNFDWVEWLGYLASFVVLISLLMASVVKLRWVNLAGASLFTIYGALIDSIPVALANFCIALIDIYYLVQFYKTRETFKALEADMDSELFRYFVETNREDIEKQIEVNKLSDYPIARYILRDNNIAGILVADRKDDLLDIKLDYVTPRYRDFKAGRYYFEEHPERFKEEGVRRLRAYAREASHRNYLEKMGFSKVSGSDNEYEKVLK